MEHLKALIVGTSTGKINTIIVSVTRIGTHTHTHQKMEQFGFTVI